MPRRSTIADTSGEGNLLETMQAIKIWLSWEMACFGWVDLFNGISISYKLFYVKIWFIFYVLVV